MVKLFWPIIRRHSQLSGRDVDADSHPTLYLTRDPDWDSGVLTLAAGTTAYTHNLGTLLTIVFLEWSDYVTMLAARQGDEATVYWNSKYADAISLTNNTGTTKYARIRMWKVV